MQTFVEIGSAVRKIFPDKKNKQIESISRVAQLTLGARLINLSTRSCDQSFFVLIGQNRLQLMSVMTIHKYVNVQASVVGPQ